MIFGVGTLAFAGHLLSPTTSEAKWKGNRLLLVGQFGGFSAYQDPMQERYFEGKWNWIWHSFCPELGAISDKTNRREGIKCVSRARLVCFQSIPSHSIYLVSLVG